MPGTDADDICIYDKTDNEKSGRVMQPLFYLLVNTQVILYMKVEPERY